MERTAEPAPPRGSADRAGVDGAPAHRDAAGIVARVEADEAEARRARVRYRTEAMTPLAPDDRIASLLAPDERVFAIRASALVDRRQPVAGSDAPTGVAGDLYVTSRRLVLVGRRTLSFELAEIEQALLSGERLLLVMRDGEGATIYAAQPRLLRVEIAAARAAVDA